MRRAASATKERVNMRDEILEAATRRFAAFGFDGVALQDIADDVAIRKASLLYHFRSKALLREAVISSLLAHWTDVLPRLMDSAIGGHRRLDALMHASIAYFAGAPYRARLLLREMLDSPEDMRARMSRQLGPWLLLLAELIRNGQRERTVHRDLDPEAYVFHVVNLVLATVAVADVSVGLYPSRQSAARATERHLKELVRLARTSLFPTRENEGGHG